MSSITLREGDILLDHRNRPERREVKLENRINPAGLSVPPYWQVRNLETGRRTTIREDTITSPRWTNLTRIEDIVDDPEAE